MPIRLDNDDSLSLPDLESSIGGYDRLHQLNPFTRIINAIRIYNVPLINFMIIGVLGTFLLKLTTKYTSLYMKSSLVTIMVTNLVLYGISETLAQTLTSYNSSRPFVSADLNEIDHVGISFNSSDIQRHNAQQNHYHVSPLLALDLSVTYEYDSDDEGVERFIDYIQDHDHDHDGYSGASLDFPQTIPYVPLSYYQFNRLAGFMCWGFVMSFAQCWWYKFLSIYARDPKFIEVLRKVLTDQLCFSPVSLFCFFTYGTMVLENGTWKDTKKKLNKIYLKTLLINYSVWFPIQFFNFLVVPYSFQVPFSSSISVLWNCFLSMRNSAAS